LADAKAGSRQHANGTNSRIRARALRGGYASPQSFIIVLYFRVTPLFDCIRREKALTRINPGACCLALDQLQPGRFKPVNLLTK
jgi:hypothetical protein